MLAAASRIVATDGLAGLTLRPLAAQLGVSVTVLSTHYGARADVIAAICHAAAARDALLFEHWRGALARLGSMPPAIAANVAETIVDELATGQRAVSALYLELMQACTWDAALRPAFADWAAARRAFWDDVGSRAGVAPALLACGWWHGYVVAELACSVALDADPAYRMLRRLCLQRLFNGGAAPAGDGAEGTLFTMLGERMRMADTATGSAASAPAWSALAARACGIRLAAQGVDALTHRAIAADIGIPHTTLSYRFPAQRDLVDAGIACIVRHIGAAVNADRLDEVQRLRTEGDGQKLDLARASFAVALAAMRRPELTACAAQMRSRRGDNVGKVLARYLPGVSGIDPLCAQVVSMGLAGLTNTVPPGAEAEALVATAFTVAVTWLGATQDMPTGRTGR
ncbi:TetR family transcriptional regulator [Pseudoduganella buxea]|uniref:TetR family transcriptional regulator n=1 Tax=Pseudoduganella buxea TaxID=1949069 RepID=A0A6I3T5B4_9BURK|nr:TetR family transcriptional regulator [Pseudoduganella buxea]MTV55906.1 TetR family transcriptional regulator [Pseudoduganella buxea]